MHVWKKKNVELKGKWSLSCCSSKHYEPAEPPFSPWVKLGKVGQKKTFDLYAIVLNVSPKALRSLPVWKEQWWKYVYLYANGQLRLSGLREWSSTGLSTYLIYLAMISLLGSHAAKMFSFYISSDSTPWPTFPITESHRSAQAPVSPKVRDS